MIRAGQLRERVTIQRSVRTGDGGGGVSEEWIGIDGNPKVRAMVSPISMREPTEAGRPEEQSTHRVVIRHRADVTGRHRLLWHARHGDVPLNIRGVPVNPDQRGIWLELKCEEGVAT